MGKNEIATVGDTQNLKAILRQDGVKNAIQAAAAKHLTPERLFSMVVTAASRNPLLFQCTQESVLKAVMDAARMGLPPDGLLGYGYLVPFKNNKTGKYEAQFMAGYRGLCQMARNSGSVKAIWGRAVYDGDRFEWHEGTDPKIIHVPSKDPYQKHDETTLKHAYCVSNHSDGSTQFTVVNRTDIEKARTMSKAKDHGPWKTHYEAMAIKTAVRQHTKWLDLSPEIRDQLAKEEAIEFGPGDYEVRDVETPRPPIGRHKVSPRPSAPVTAPQEEEPPSDPPRQEEPVRPPETPKKPRRKAKATTSEETQTVSTVVQTVDEHHGESAKGPWTLFIIKTDDGEFTTFSETIAGDATAYSLDEGSGVSVEIDWVPGKKEGSREITGIRALDDEAGSNTAPDDDEIPFG